MLVRFSASSGVVSHTQRQPVPRPGRDGVLTRRAAAAGKRNRIRTPLDGSDFRQRCPAVPYSARRVPRLVTRRQATEPQFTVSPNLFRTGVSRTQRGCS